MVSALRFIRGPQDAAVVCRGWGPDLGSFLWIGETPQRPGAPQENPPGRGCRRRPATWGAGPGLPLPGTEMRTARSRKPRRAAGVGGARHSALLSARAGVPDPLCRLSVPVRRIWGNRPEFGFDVSLAEGAATPKRPASVTCRCARRGVLAATRPRPGRAPTPALRAAASGFAVNPAA